jgi:hypothetical protein
MKKAICEAGNMDKEDLIDEAEDTFDGYKDWYGDDYEIKYKNIKIKDVDKFDRDDIDDVLDAIEDETDVKVRIQKMCEVEVSYRMWDYNEEEWVKSEETLVLYKSAGNWYVMEFSGF